MTVLTAPGVYVDERPPSVRTIVGVSTSVTAFVGDTERGPVGVAVSVFSMPEFVRNFGSTLGEKRPLANCVSHYFANGGSEAVVVRVERPKAVVGKATVGGLELEAIGPGKWSSGTLKSGKPWLQAEIVDLTTVGTHTRFTLELQLKQNDLFDNPKAKPERATVLQEESLAGLLAGAGDSTSPDFWVNRLKSASLLAKAPKKTKPSATLSAEKKDFTGGTDGDELKTSAKLLVPDPADNTGIYSLDQRRFPRFNLLCIPDLDALSHAAEAGRVVAYCRKEAAIYLMDSHAELASALVNATLIDADAHAAMYHPRLVVNEASLSGAATPSKFPPCGAVAGVIARTDATRGVWKAPAGLDAGIVGISGFAEQVNDDWSGKLNQLGINALRTFDAGGPVIWGARTARGSDALASEHKYLPVRRTTDYIASSLKVGTMWAVFEPNDPDLWASLRASVVAFMRTCFRAGAFQQSMSKAERDSFFVTCDDTNNPQEDIDRGIVNVTVGFAPLKPAEFVVITITQISRLEA